MRKERLMRYAISLMSGLTLAVASVSLAADGGALFVLLRVLFEGFATGGMGENGLDRTRLVHYARAYVDTQGPNREIVAHWLKYLERDAH